MTLLVLLLSTLLSIASAFPWQGPQQTQSATSTANWTPAPTSNANEDISFLELIRRDTYPVSVCGWIGGSVAQPAYCSTQSSCVWNSDYKIVGCCATTRSNCQFYTSCIDINSPQQSGDSENIFTCRGTSVCYLNTYPENYKQWGCGSSNWATDIATSYAGMAKDISLQIVTTGSAAQGSGAGSSKAVTTQKSAIQITASSSSNPSSFLNSQVASQTPPSGSGNSFLASTSVSTSATSSSNPPSDTSTSSTSTSSKSSAPVAAITGGAIGGIAVIALVGALCFFLRRKRNRSPSRNMHLGSDNQSMQSIVQPLYSSHDLMVPVPAHHTSGPSAPNSHQDSVVASSEQQWDKRGALIEPRMESGPGSAHSAKAFTSAVKKPSKPKRAATAGSISEVKKASKPRNSSAAGPGTKNASRPKISTTGGSSSK